MKVGLFIPCYVDQLYPQVGKATLQLLQELLLDVDYPLTQTCCGQPMSNSGCEKDSITTSKLFVDTFHTYDYIVAPSASCVLHVREHYDILPQNDRVKHVRDNTYELIEFLHDILKIEELNASFPQKVGLHMSCHGHRGMRLSKSSELVGEPFSKTKAILKMVKGIKLVDLDRWDECCGFGGTFAVSEEAVSSVMGEDRVTDHHSHGVEVLTSNDMSCLMHLEGIIKRTKKNIAVKHIAEILTNKES